MTAAEIDAALTALHAELTALTAGTSAARVREEGREVEFRKTTPAEIRQRIAELEALRDGRPPRTRGRLVMS